MAGHPVTSRVRVEPDGVCAVPLVESSGVVEIMCIFVVVVMQMDVKKASNHVDHRAVFKGDLGSKPPEDQARKRELKLGEYETWLASGGAGSPVMFCEDRYRFDVREKYAGHSTTWF